MHARISIYKLSDKTLQQEYEDTLKNIDKDTFNEILPSIIKLTRNKDTMLSITKELTSNKRSNSKMILINMDQACMFYNVIKNYDVKELNLTMALFLIMLSKKQKTNNIKEV